MLDCKKKKKETLSSFQLENNVASNVHTGTITESKCIKICKKKNLKFACYISTAKRKAMCAVKKSKCGGDIIIRIFLLE